MKFRLRQWLRRSAIVTVTAAVVLTGATGPVQADVYWGVNSCTQGYVWREARASDQVCVTPSTRDRAWADNAAAPGRWVNGPYGPHTCINGFVWREAFPGDDVCVTPDIRSQAAQDNALAATRVAPADEYHCTRVNGLGNDDVCVKLGRDPFGNFTSILVRYRHYSGAFNTVQAGIIWSTTHGGSGSFPSQVFTGNSGREWTATLPRSAPVGTCAVANAFITSPPYDPNAQVFPARVDVCRFR